MSSPVAAQDGPVARQVLRLVRVGADVAASLLVASAVQIASVGAVRE